MIVRLVLLMLAAAALLVAWRYRQPLLSAVRGATGWEQTQLPPTARSDVGAPTEASFDSAEAKWEALSRPGGPDSVVLTANETASLIGAGMDWGVRRAFDSLRVELLEGRIALHARLETSRLPKEALGPLTGVLDLYEPMRLGATVTIEEPGRARLMVDEFRVRSFTFPRSAVTRLVRRVAPAEPDGSLLVTVPEHVGAVRIAPEGVTLMRAKGVS